MEGWNVLKDTDTKFFGFHDWNVLLRLTSETLLAYDMVVQDGLYVRGCLSTCLWQYGPPRNEWTMWIFR
jgi:hypothetical protein